MPAFDRYDSAACRNCAGEPLQGGRDEDVLAGRQHLDWHSGLGRLPARRQKWRWHVFPIQIESVDVVGDRAPRLTPLSAGARLADKLEGFNEFHSYPGAKR